MRVLKSQGAVGFGASFGVGMGAVAAANPTGRSEAAYLACRRWSRALAGEVLFGSSEHLGEIICRQIAGSRKIGL